MMAWAMVIMVGTGRDLSLQRHNHSIINKMKHRKPNRLKGYDYSQDNLYFVTSCVHDMVCCFGVVVVGTGRDLSSNTGVELWPTNNDDIRIDNTGTDNIGPGNIGTDSIGTGRDLSVPKIK
jgi:hypothetical protein